MTTELYTKKYSYSGYSFEEAEEKAKIVAEAYKSNTAKSPWNYPEIIPDPRGCEGYAIRISMRRRNC